jgi:hypothetical protein
VAERGGLRSCDAPRLAPTGARVGRTRSPLGQPGIESAAGEHANGADAPLKRDGARLIRRRCPGLNQEMGNTTIFVRVLGEAVDCWRPVDGIDQGQASYLIVGPEPTANEQWEFGSRTGSVPSAGRTVSRGATHQRQKNHRTPHVLAASIRSVGCKASPRRRPSSKRSMTDPIGLLATARRLTIRPGSPHDSSRLPGANGVDDVMAILHKSSVDGLGRTRSYQRQVPSSGVNESDAVRRY